MKNLNKMMLTALTAICLSATGAVAEVYNYTETRTTTDGGVYSQYSVPEADRNTMSREYRTEESIPSLDTGNDIVRRSNSSVTESTQTRTDIYSNTQVNTGQVRLSSSKIQEVQQNLRDEGYSLAVDGIWGPQTANAVRMYQQEEDLAVTGTLNHETLSALDVDIPALNSDAFDDNGMMNNNR